MRYKDWSFLDMARISDYFSQISGKITLGIDGYIDEVWQVIESRISVNEYRLYSEMKSFGELVVKCGTGGVSNEIIRKRRSYGGFTANTGKAAGRLGAKASMLGMYGKISIDPVFAEFCSLCSLVSVGDPGVSHILEFEDGKIMLPYINEIIGFGWDDLLEALGEDGLTRMFAEPDIIALGYWSLMPAFDDVVSNICANFIRKDNTQRMFFDFADIRKRDRASLEDTLRRLAVLNSLIPMSLSLNEHEAELLFTYLGEDFKQDADLSHKIIGRMREKTGLDEIIVHTPYFASAASATEGVCTVPQLHCEKPLITTGAGDNFNGGYLAASLHRGTPRALSLAERLVVGNAATGFYVSNGYSADKEDIVKAVQEMKGKI